MKLNKYLPEICILVLAILVRLINLNGSFWLDEAAQALESIRPLSEQLQISADFQPPLYHLIVHLLIQFNQTEIWLRLASLIPGLITVWLTMKIGQRLFNRDVGLTAGVLLATSQFHLFYSQELRPYSLAACLGVMTVWYWINLMESKKRVSIGLFLSMLAGLYTMYVFLVLLITLAVITVIWYRQKFLLLISYFLFLALAFLPWLPSFLEQLSIGSTLASGQPIWANIVSPPLFKMLPLVFLKFVIGRIPIDVDITTILVTLVILYFVLLLFVRTLKQKYGKIMIALVVLPSLFGFIISIFVPVLDPKRVMFSLPFLYLALSAGINKKINSVVALIFFLIINMAAISQYATDPETQREPWKQAVMKIEASASREDLAIFAFDAPFAPWVWYQTENLQTLALTDPNDLPRLTSPQVFLFDYLRPLYDPNDDIAKLINQEGYQQTGFYQYPGIGKIRIYAH